MTIAVEGARVAFDIAEGWTPEWYMLIPVGLTFAGLFGVVLSGREASFPAFMSWLVLLGGLAFGLLGGMAFYGQYARLRDARLSANHDVVEGCLEAFHPLPENGKGGERVRVAGKTFSYSDYRMTAAFHRSEISGGPIHRDSWVRITHVGNDIVRLEVADGACPPQMRDAPPVE